VFQANFLSRADAEELMQDTLGEICRQIRSLREPVRLGAWTLRLARGKTVDFLRQRATQRRGARVVMQSIERDGVDCIAPACTPSESAVTHEICRVFEKRYAG